MYIYGYFSSGFLYDVMSILTRIFMPFNGCDWSSGHESINNPVNRDLDQGEGLVALLSAGSLCHGQ